MHSGNGTGKKGFGVVLFLGLLSLGACTGGSVIQKQVTSDTHDEELEANRTTLPKKVIQKQVTSDTHDEELEANRTTLPKKVIQKQVTFDTPNLKSLAGDKTLPKKRKIARQTDILT
jgi:hypothetical protein